MRCSASSGDEDDEQEEREGAPEPAALDEVDVEDVAFLSEVGGGEGLRLEGLLEDVVGA